MENNDEIVFNCSYDKDMLKKLQDILWKMYCEVSDIFDKNNITYFLAFGTLIGAARHGDFIPWDDDLDICIMKDDYDKALQLLEKYLSDDFAVDYFAIKRWNHAKVRHLKSEMTPYGKIDTSATQYPGICMDLFRCWQAKHRRWDRKIGFLQIRRMVAKNNIIKYFAYNIMVKFLIVINKFTKEKTFYDTDPISDNLPHYPKEWIFPLTKLNFRGRSCPVPNNYDAMLSARYEFDWRTLPPMNERHNHFQAIKIWE